VEFVEEMEPLALVAMDNHSVLNTITAVFAEVTELHALLNAIWIATDVSMLNNVNGVLPKRNVCLKIHSTTAALTQALEMLLNALSHY